MKAPKILNIVKARKKINNLEDEHRAWELLLVVLWSTLIISYTYALCVLADIIGA